MEWIVEIEATGADPHVGRRLQQLGKSFEVLYFARSRQSAAMLAEIEAAFAPPVFRDAPTGAYDAFHAADPVFRAWADTNLHAHKVAGYAIVTISLKAHGETPGDATSDQMREIAALAKAEASDEVAAAYVGKELKFGPDYLIPKPFDSRLILKIAPAVAQAAEILQGRAPVGAVNAAAATRLARLRS